MEAIETTAIHPISPSSRNGRANRKYDGNWLGTQLIPGTLGV